MILLSKTRWLAQVVFQYKHFGNLMAPISVAAHTVNNLDLSDGEGLDRFTLQEPVGVTKSQQNERGDH